MKGPLLAAATILALPVCASAEEASVSLVITHARVIDVRHGSVGAPVDIAVAGERIVAIHAAGTSNAAAGALRLDGSGKFVVPGYWDMHVHVNGNDAEHWMLPMFVAAGVTGVRDMAGDCVTPGCPESLASMRTLQRRLESGEVVGPRILAIASAQVDGPHSLEQGAPTWSSPGSVPDAQTLVREFKARGADFIKPYQSIPRDAYFEMLRSASAAGIRLSGHVPMSVTALEAVEGGQLTIEHAIRPALDCGTYSDGLHQRYARWASGASDEGDERNYYPRILASFDKERCGRIIAGIAATRAWYVPTHVTRRFEAMAVDPLFLADGRLRFVPRSVLRYWQDDAAGMAKRFEDLPGQKQAYLDFYRLGLKLTGQMHRAGVPVLAGSDALDSYAFPGSGLHDEFLELAKAGLSNAEVLRAATLDAAEFLGREAQFGTVEPGKSADLVLLAANPLTDIANAGRVDAVVLRGVPYPPERLKALQADVARYAARTMENPAH